MKVALVYKQEAKENGSNPNSDRSQSNLAWTPTEPRAWAPGSLGP